MKSTVSACTILCVGLLSLPVLFVPACQNDTGVSSTDGETQVSDADGETQNQTTQPEDAGQDAEVVSVAARKGGAQLWGENCMRCHNYRIPAERSRREWEIIVHHMRVRANLTAEEHRLILQFLQAAN